MLTARSGTGRADADRVGDIIRGSLAYPLSATAQANVLTSYTSGNTVVDLSWRPSHDQSMYGRRSVSASTVHSKLIALSCQRHHLHTAWDNSLLPKLRVESGAVVEFDCIDASNGQIHAGTTVEDMASVDLANMNPLFGPVSIENAEPGDVVRLCCV